MNGEKIFTRIQEFSIRVGSCSRAFLAHSTIHGLKAFWWSYRGIRDWLATSLAPSFECFEQKDFGGSRAVLPLLISQASTPSPKSPDKGARAVLSRFTLFSLGILITSAISLNQVSKKEKKNCQRHFALLLVFTCNRSTRFFIHDIFISGYFSASKLATYSKTWSSCQIRRKCKW